MGPTSKGRGGEGREMKGGEGRGEEEGYRGGGIRRGNWREGVEGKGKDGEGEEVSLPKLQTLKPPMLVLLSTGQSTDMSRQQHACSVGR